MPLRTVPVLLALCLAVGGAAAAANDVEIEADLDENTLLLEFSESTRRTCTGGVDVWCSRARTAASKVEIAPAPDPHKSSTEHRIACRTS
jgi:hypothetical protein